jgi:5'(3')-deoxyribonucleotidase
MPNPENKETIAVDIDDVLVPHVEDLIAWHNREYGTQMIIDLYHSRDPKDWGAANIEEAIKRVQRFFTTPDFLEARPIDEASDALQQLSETYNLIVITARDNIIEGVTKSWLDRHFPEIFKESHFTARFNLEGGSKAKSAVALSAKAKYLIDDTLENALDAASVGLEVLLFGEYPWNQLDKLPENVTRIKNWQEVLEYFDGRS